MIELDIPGYGVLRLEHLVSDFTGTLAFDGRLLPGMKDLLNDLARVVTVHVLTADTFGRSREELEGVNCSLTVLSGNDVDLQKGAYISALGAERTAAVGNGVNDRWMLKSARVGIAIIGREGCAVEAQVNADIIVNDVRDALELLLNPKRLTATLRF